MFGSSLPPVVGRRVRVLCTLFVFVCAEWCVQQHTGLCFYFVCLRPVLFTQCCQILYIVHSWLPLWYSLAYIYFFHIDLSLYIDTRFVSLLCKYTFIFVCFFMVFNAFFNNISVISWRSVLLVEETGGPGENHRYIIT